jgi:hypothetical protein
MTAFGQKQIVRNVRFWLARKADIRRKSDVSQVLNAEMRVSAGVK